MSSRCGNIDVKAQKGERNRFENGVYRVEVTMVGEIASGNG